MFCRFILAYIDDLLIITKVDWSDHKENLELTLPKLKDNVLKCSIKRSFYG